MQNSGFTVLVVMYYVRKNELHMFLALVHNVWRHLHSTVLNMPANAYDSRNIFELNERLPPVKMF